MTRKNKLLSKMLGAEIDFIVRGIDSKTRAVVASRKEAMLKKRQTFYMDLDANGVHRIHEGRLVQARVIAVAEKGIRVLIQPLVYRLVCSNGMVVNDAKTRKYHIGKTNSLDGNFELYEQDTLDAIDTAFVKQIRDTVYAAVDQTRFDNAETYQGYRAAGGKGGFYEPS